MHNFNFWQYRAWGPRKYYAIANQAERQYEERMVNTLLGGFGGYGGADTDARRAQASREPKRQAPVPRKVPIISTTNICVGKVEPRRKPVVRRRQASVSSSSSAQDISQQMPPSPPQRKSIDADDEFRILNKYLPAPISRKSIAQKVRQSRILSQQDHHFGSELFSCTEESCWQNPLFCKAEGCWCKQVHAEHSYKPFPVEAASKETIETIPTEKQAKAFEGLHEILQRTIEKCDKPSSNDQLTAQKPKPDSSQQPPSQQLLTPTKSLKRPSTHKKM